MNYGQVPVFGGSSISKLANMQKPIYDVYEYKQFDQICQRPFTDKVLERTKVIKEIQLRLIVAQLLQPAQGGISMFIHPIIKRGFVAFMNFHPAL